MEIIKNALYQGDEYLHYGVIVKHEGFRWFIELDTEAEQKRFDTFVETHDMENPMVVYGEMLYSFTHEDYDEERFAYAVKKGDEYVPIFEENPAKKTFIFITRLLLMVEIPTPSNNESLNLDIIGGKEERLDIVVDNAKLRIYAEESADVKTLAKMIADKLIITGLDALEQIADYGKFGSIEEIIADLLWEN